jgi:hypothetical protein
MTSTSTCTTATNHHLANSPAPSTFPTVKQPYWRDPRAQVVTETRVVCKPQGGWVVEKKKYLVFPEDH